MVINLPSRLYSHAIFRPIMKLGPMCCILKIGLLVRFKDGTNVLYT